MLSHPEKGPGLKLATQFWKLQKYNYAPHRPTNISALTRADRNKNETWLKKLLLEACSLGNYNFWNKIYREGHDKTGLKI